MNALRTLCVWYPDWPLVGIEVEPGRPCFVYEDRSAGGGEAQRVRAANPVAREAGVGLGMGRRAAEAMCPTAITRGRDLGDETRRFEPVVTTLESLVPRVEVVEPGLALIPIAGAVRYYGGETTLVEKVDRELALVAANARLGLADGPFAARWAAMVADRPLIVENTAAFLATLDIAVLERAELIDTFRWLGVTTLGALARLPRQAIASRFGEAGLLAHRLASGEDRDPSPRVIPADLAVESHHDDPLESLDQVAFIARALSARLMSSLRRDGVAPHRVEIEVESAGGVVRTRTWRSADPFFEASLVERVWWQLRTWVEQGGVTGGVVRIRLDPFDLSSEGRQLALFEGGFNGDGGWQSYDSHRLETERALARAQALVGPDAVLEADRQGGRMPREQVLWRRYGEEHPLPERDPASPWPGATPGPAPALIPPEPVAIDVEWDVGTPTRVRLGSRWEPVLNWAGPWRLLGRWWQGEQASDRYQIVTSAGALLIEVREGRSLLAGLYD